MAILISGTLKGVNDAYWNITYNEAGLKARIDLAKSYGADMYEMLMHPIWINNIRIGASSDYIATSINYAHSLGMKLKILMSPAWYPNGWTVTTREEFKTNLTSQQKFLDDVVFLANRYSSLDGIELEEPHQYAQSATNAPFWNLYFARLHDALLPVLNARPNFAWGFNFISTNTDAEVLNQGIDVNYINNNRLFRTAHLQNYSDTLQGFKDHITRYKTKLSNLEISSYVYLNSRSYTSTTCQANIDQSQCWNQAAIEQVKYAHDIGHAVSIFILGRLSATTQNKFPAYASQGATVGDIIRGYWSSVPQPPPVKIQIDAISAGNGKIMALDDPTRVGISYGLSLDPGAPWKFTALPGPGYIFSKWVGDDGNTATTAMVSGTAVYDLQLTAYFVLAPQPPQTDWAVPLIGIISAAAILKDIKKVI